MKDMRIKDERPHGWGLCTRNRKLTGNPPGEVGKIIFRYALSGGYLNSLEGIGNGFLRSSWWVMITSREMRKAVGSYFGSMLIWVDYNPPTECVATIKILPGYISRFCWEKHTQFAYVLIFFVGRCGLTCSRKIARKPVPRIWFLSKAESHGAIKWI